MKNTSFILVSSFLVFVACSKVPERSSVYHSGSKPIEFVIEAENEAQTKAFTEVTTSNLTTFYCTALKSDNSQLFKNVAFTGTSGSNYTSSWYWPVTGNLSFYAISKSYTQTISGTNITVPVSSADGDVVCAVKTGVSNGSTSALTFNHIMADLEAITFSAPSGYSITITSLSYQLKKSGTYNISSNTWSNVASLSSATSVTSPSTSNSIKALCAPASGNCVINVTYSCSKGGYSESYTRSATVTLAAGKKSTVSGVLGANPGTLQLNVSVADWEAGEEINSEL